jgi:transposase InsO family protein
MKRVISINAHADSQTASYRLEVVQFYQHHGLAATLAAFPVKRSTLLLWQQKLKVSGGRLSSLIPGSTKPHRVRVMRTHPLVLAELCRLRKAHYRLGKHKLYPLLKRYCERVRLETPKESTLGKIIKRNHLFYGKPSRNVHDPNRKEHVKHPKFRVCHAPSPQSGGYVELDTIETIVAGLRRYTITAIDVKLKLVYAQTFKGKQATHTLVVLKTLASVLPVPIHTVQTDNGSEFAGVFDQYCQNQRINHHWTYPRSPKINGVIERFNRTLQEEWLDLYRDELMEPERINPRIREYLDFYHHDRIHESLADHTPAEVVGYTINYSPSPICP